MFYGTPRVIGLVTHTFRWRTPMVLSCCVDVLMLVQTPLLSCYCLAYTSTADTLLKQTTWRNKFMVG